MKLLEHVKLFHQCREIEVLSDDTVVIRCKLGLWRVEGKSIQEVEQNAFHYWQQYYADGEYNLLLDTINHKKGEK